MSSSSPYVGETFQSGANSATITGYNSSNGAADLDISTPAGDYSQSGIQTYGSPSMSTAFVTDPDSGTGSGPIEF